MFFSYHNNVHRELNYDATLHKSWNGALDFSHKGLVSDCHQMHFINLKVNVTIPRLLMLLLARFLDLKLEDKAHNEGRSIVIKQSYPNNHTNKYIKWIDIGTSRTNTRNKVRPFTKDNFGFTLHSISIPIFLFRVFLIELLHLVFGSCYLKFWWFDKT